MTIRRILFTVIACVVALYTIPHGGVATVEAGPLLAADDTPSPDDGDSDDAGGGPDDNDDSDDDGDGRESSDLLGFVEYGPYPTSHYEIGCDEGAWNHMSRKFWCMLQPMPFEVTKYSVGISNSMLTWALDASIARALTDETAEISEAYNTTLVAGLELRHLAWTIAATWICWLLLRARSSQAAGEFFVAVIAALISGIMIANPAGYMNGMLDTMTSTSDMLVESVDGSGHSSTAQTTGTQITDSFVRAPYDLLNWGGPLTGICADTRDEILSRGAFGNDDYPRNAMQTAGCTEQAEFNHDPSPERFFSGVVLASGSILLLILIVMLSLGLLVAQVLLLPLWAVMPIVLTLAIAPGPTRRLAGWFAGGNAAVLLLFITTTITLTFVTSASRVVLAATDNVILQRMIVLNVVVIAGYIVRRRLVAAAKSAGKSFGAAIGTLGPARSGPSDWMSNANVHAARVRSQVEHIANEVPGGRRMYNRADAAQQRVRHAAADRVKSTVRRRSNSPTKPQWNANRRRGR